MATSFSTAIVSIGINPYELTAEEAATFRRDTIGAVPQNLGLIPELRMIDQIALPMKLAGVDDETIIAEIRKLTSELMPLHNLLVITLPSLNFSSTQQLSIL